ncbi:MAG: methyl-accepting chemotaxis protein [Magnetococcales bacterium]|nr:methyl-accepting chemotaxis protein [Magnetococcales bacterium]
MSHALESPVPPTSPAAVPPCRRVPLRHFLPIVFCLLIGTVSLLIIFITHRSATHSIESLAEEVMTRVSQRVVEKTSYYLDSAAQAVQMNATVWQRGLRGAAKEEQTFLEFFNRTSREQLTLFPYFGLVYYGDQQGNHWLNKREQDGTIHVRVITRKDDSPASKRALEQWAGRATSTEQERQTVALALAPYLETHWYEVDKQGQLVHGERDPLKNFDPRLRPWYVGAREKNKLFWTDVYVWEEKYQGVVSHQLGITVSAPMVRAGQLAGVCGIDISLQAVSHFLRDMEIMKNGRAFILNAKGETVGLPNYGEVLEKTAAADETIHLNHINKISDLAVTTSYAALRTALGLTEEQPFVLPRERVITFAVADQQYYGFYKPFATDLGLNWTVGVVIPADDFLGGVKEEMHQSLLIALVSICFMSAAGILVGRLITNPLAHLGREVERIMQLDLAPSPSLTTRFLEFRMISLAFTRMKLALAEMVNSLAVHTKPMDWSAEELTNIALTLEEGTQTMQEGVGTVQTLLQQLPEQIPEKEEMIQVMAQVEDSLRTLHHLNQPVIEQVDQINESIRALRQTLQAARI